MKRRGKFYSKDEKQTLRELGLVPTKASGAGWVEKEDGYNEKVLVQLKVTDADSYRINKFDLDQLEYHASIEKKIPIFLIKYLTTNEIYAIMRIQDAKSIIDDEQDVSQHSVENFVDNSDELREQRRKVVMATRKKDIEKFYEEEKRRKNWKR